MTNHRFAYFVLWQCHIRTPGEWIRGYVGRSCPAAAKRGHAGGLRHR